MSDDYLWDGRGTPDPDVQHLEALLGRLRTTRPAPRIEPRPIQWRTPRYLAPLMATAAVILIMIGLTLQTPRASWDVATLSGRPRVGAATLTGNGRIAAGDMLVTDGTSQARMTVAAIGQVTVDTNTAVRLVETRDGHHRLALVRGTLHAVISALPGQFVVDTPSATATDLGCIYTLHVDEDGAGLLSVSKGWVALEREGREALVPVGASCRIDPNRGPGTPSYDDADQMLREALDDFDAASDAAARTRTLAVVLDHAGPGDAVTLWHLISRVDPADRPRVVDMLASFLPLPAGVTREAVLRLDAAALDQWWNTLGLGEASWWRTLKAPYPASP